MNWIKSFFGLYDKKQAIKTAEVADYVRGKKNEFTKDMDTLQKQAKAVGEITKKSHEEAVKLNETVDDITARIAIAVGSYKIVRKKP